SYAAKYASAFYGPFREAAGSAPKFGDRRSYQMDPPNADEALKEIALDLDEGADLVMVKPGLPCLDILRRAKDRFGGPIAAYQVSGEYSWIKLAAERGALDGKQAMWEATIALRRAGADIIITYAAPELVQIIGR
ncbi:MAG: porphobilinogen synthase, partial [Gemmatimonadetes bacterium]|nr:porphobilinogen synthase [Gemmatimonadota bacterium]